MPTNELFRLLSLRKSKPSSGRTTPVPDARLRYRPLLQAQAVAHPSPREAALRELKRRYAELSRKMTQLEKVQRALIDTYFVEREGVPEPRLSRPRRAGAASRRAAAVTHPAAARPVVGWAIADPTRFAADVTSRLQPAEADLFREVIASTPTALNKNFSHVLGLFAVAVYGDEANKVCAQIHALEERVAEELPTAPSMPASEVPIVAAVGWGDLIVARESLVGYQAREVAHIENVLPGETKLRKHERLSKTEEVAETETITEKESEKDSQTTDRYELQAESQSAINRNFSISAGVNTSGQYGLTQIDTSLDGAFSQSESQSRSSSITTAREIVTKAVERTFERVRRLRRLTITEQIKELNRHELANVGGPPAPAALSGMYLWVEKIQKVELRHYGRRMMVEFHVPEPAVSLHERAAVAYTKKRLPPFDVSPAGVHAGNYMCLAQRYNAPDVEPPPTTFIDVGYGWVSKLNEEDEGWAEDQFTSTINVPAGYRPIRAKVAWSALRGPKERRADFNFAFSVGGRSLGIEWTVPTYDNVVLTLPAASDWPQGVPVSGRVHGAWDGAMYVQVTLGCVRTDEAMDAWRLRTWQSLRAGYEALERETAQDEQRQDYTGSLLGPSIIEGATAENRRIERAELQKWAIKSMRLVPQNLNAIEKVGEQQEMSPAHADAQAPIVRFYEDAFEWEHMTYFLYSYHWARRASWRMRTAVVAADPRHQAFLEAGAARVIVPVKPGFESKVAAFLEPANAGKSELDRILDVPPTTAPTGGHDAFRDLWIELFTEHKPDSARGSGTLTVTNGDVEIRINADSNWRASAQRDLARELYIDGARYEVAAVTNETTLKLDRPYEGESDAKALYAASSTPFGPPWLINVPTSLVVLADNVAALKAL